MKKSGRKRECPRFIGHKTLNLHTVQSRTGTDSLSYQKGLKIMDEVTPAVRPYRVVVEAERRLVRVGHLCWYMRKQALRANDTYAVDGFDRALECIWTLKRDVR